ncbi:MAG: RpiB/LacA/LacB family sugar-phosphate isomerase [Candidatus Woesearchaeota archaeon]
MLYLGSDHAGYKVKQLIKKYLDLKKMDYLDLGPAKINLNDDYPDYAKKVAKKIILDNSKKIDSKGILVCGTGLGMSIAANKLKGIRAVTPYDIKTAKLSRSHNNSNIIALRGKGFSINKQLKILEIWLKTPYTKSSRHERRLKKIDKLK